MTDPTLLLILSVQAVALAAMALCGRGPRCPRCGRLRASDRRGWWCACGAGQ